jgi:hypothetical protein
MVRCALFALFLLGFASLGSERASSQSPLTLPSSASAAFQIRQIAYIKASNPHAGDHFGCGGNLPGHVGNSVALSADGNILAVGAHVESSAARGFNGDQNDTSLYASGAVYVFARQGNSWVQQAYVKPSNPQQGASFGMNVALNADGATMAVSAYFESSSSKGVNSVQNDQIPQAGAVYIFTRSGAAWSQQAYIKASNTGRPVNVADPNDWGDGDQFGLSIALSADGNTLAVGAPTEDSRAVGINNAAFENDDSAASSGAVYVFTRSGGRWSQRDYIKGSNTDGGDLFGYTVALTGDGNTLAVGAYDEDGSGRSVNPIPDNRRNGTGAVYVFVRDGGAWRQQVYLKGSRSQGNDAMGVSLTISADGSTLVAGTAEEACLVPGINPPGCDVDTHPPHIAAGTAGAAYVWVRNGNTWTEQAFIKASNPDIEDWFAVRVALSADGNTLLVGAQNEDSNARGINGNQADNSATEAGAAYVFTRSGGTWTQGAYLKGSNTEAFDEFGSATAISGDGKTVVLGARMESSAAKGVGADQNDNSAQSAGAAYVFTVN